MYNIKKLKEIYEANAELMKDSMRILLDDIKEELSLSKNWNS